MTLQLSSLERIEYALLLCKSCGHSAVPFRLADESYLSCFCLWLRMCESVPYLTRDWAHNGVYYRQTWPGLAIEASR